LLNLADCFIAGLYPGFHPLLGLQYYTCGKLEWLESLLTYVSFCGGFFHYLFFKMLQLNPYNTCFLNNKDKVVVFCPLSD
jgi:hypothetical protein